MSRQMNQFDVLYVDSFAGGGGASTGIEMATGHPVDIAINHDESAIMMHKRNHPYTEHYREDIWQVDPVHATHGQHVRLAWFSPDCKHFSRAKGAALVDRHIRGLAWVVLRWAGLVRPDVIMLENVPEFVTWGPVRRGKPIKSKAGQTYEKWHRQLSDLGYQIESRELCAADYGAPTIRTRFCLIARCDGQPIVWPERTHAPADSLEVQAGKCEPWRAAAEIIDWTIPMYSIFQTKQEIREKYGVNAVRPLADNTLRRIIRGVDKFTIRSGKPYIVFSNTGGSVGADTSQPVGTVRTSGGEVFSAAQLIQYHTEQSGQARGSSLEKPLPVIDASNRHGLVSACLTEYYGNGVPIDIREPMRTVTSHDREALTAVHLDKYFAGGYTCAGNRADEPITTITAEPRHSVVGAHIVKYYGGVTGANPADPMPTVTAVDHNAICASHIVKFKGKNLGQSPEKPLQTITAQSNPYAMCHTVIQQYETCEDLGYWPKVRELLNRHCGYRLADNEILLLILGGTAYYIRDILLRMLTPRELYDAMGFPHDYIIDRDVDGRPIKKADQVARCGNAVCPAVSEAMVRANLPECAKTKFTSMDALHKAMSS